MSSQTLRPGSGVHLATDLQLLSKHPRPLGAPATMTPPLAPSLPRCLVLISWPICKCALNVYLQGKPGWPRAGGRRAVTY